MTWVKRGGGTGTGTYGEGLAAATLAQGQFEEAARSAHPAVSSISPEVAETAAAGRTAPTAYTATRWTDVLGNRVMLDLLAQCVNNGDEPEMSMYYEDALTTFGAGSAHFTAACQGQTGAGAHYQRTVADGQFRTF